MIRKLWKRFTNWFKYDPYANETEDDWDSRQW